jgi:pullulanase
MILRSLLFFMGLSLSLSATAAPQVLADCQAEPSAVISRASMSSLDARAVWLNATLLRWPGRDSSGKFKLVYSSSAAVVAMMGKKITGAQRTFELSVLRTAVPESLQARFKYLGESGVLLGLRAGDQAGIADLMQGQLLLVHEDSRGRVKDATAIQHAGFIDAVYSPKAELQQDLGVSLSAEATQFKLWAPTASAVSVCLFSDSAQPAQRLVAMQKDPGSGVWSARTDSNLRNSSYQFLIDVFARGVGQVRNLVSDPYSISLNAGGERSFIADLNAPELMPEGWAENKQPAPLAQASDMNIYELHVRDFSVNDLSVAAPLRGKYLAFTKLQSNGMRHLAALQKSGLTDVHLLPVFDFATVPETDCVSPEIPSAAADSEAQQAAAERSRAGDCFNWGYDPKHFGAPEGSYASDAAAGAVRVREFRAMVDALHRTGLRVGMDVVYNHTSHSGQHPQSVLDRIVPGYYHRLNANGEIERSTCCDNTATEHTMMAKLMVDTAVRWVRDYRIDSFRFDLMGHQPLSAMLALQKAVDAAADKPVQLVGEGWNFGEVANNQRFVQAAQLSLAGSGIASFSDRARDAARGGGCCDSGLDIVRRQGYLNGLHYDANALNSASNGLNGASDSGSRTELLKAADLMRLGLAGTIASYQMTDYKGQLRALSQIDYAGQPAGYVQQPFEAVNYVENHDNPTLFDINALKLPIDTSTAERARVQILGAASVLLSQGIPYIHAGMEGLRSKSLDRNSYDSGDWFNRIDWTFTDNYFGTGLPPKSDNGANYAIFKPLLANPALKPSALEIQWTRDRFLELMQIRASTRLLRLPDAAAINQRLKFINTGPAQIPTVLAGVIDGTDLPGAAFKRLAFFINVDIAAHKIAAPNEVGMRYALHPVQHAAIGKDARLADARFDAERAEFSVPARTAVVFVVDAPQ